MTRHDHKLACRLYAKPNKCPTPVNTSSSRIDDLVRRLMTREMTFAELHEAVKTELENVFEAGQLLTSEKSGVQKNGSG